MNGGLTNAVIEPLFPRRELSRSLWPDESIPSSYCNCCWISLSLHIVIITLFKMKKWTGEKSHISTWTAHPVFFLCHTAFQFPDSVLSHFIGMACITLKSALISGKLCAKKGNQRSCMTSNRPKSLWKFQRRCYAELGATHRKQLLASGLSRLRRKRKVTAQMRVWLGVVFLDENLSVKVLARTSRSRWVFDGNF